MAQLRACRLRFKALSQSSLCLFQLSQMSQKWNQRTKMVVLSDSHWISIKMVKTKGYHRVWKIRKHCKAIKYQLKALNKGQLQIIHPTRTRHPRWNLRCLPHLKIQNLSVRYKRLKKALKAIRNRTVWIQVIVMRQMKHKRKSILLGKLSAEEPNLWWFLSLRIKIRRM